MSWFETNAMLVFCILASAVATLLPKILPVTLLKDDDLPRFMREWLSFVPVAVMAALVGGDVFFYKGNFDISVSNLFLMAALPSLLVAWVSRNYFVTIAFGIGMVILARWLGGD